MRENRTYGLMRRGWGLAQPFTLPRVEPVLTAEAGRRTSEGIYSLTAGIGSLSQNFLGMILNRKIPARGLNNEGSVINR